MKKGSPALEPEPFSVFFNARGFHAAAHFLDQKPQKHLLAFPMIVCESFGLELHLKALHVLRGRWREVSKEHNIRKLFELLSESDQDAIKKYLEQILLIHTHPHYDQQSEKDGLFEIDSILDRASTMFVAARYWHEMPLPTDAKGRASTAAICVLSDSISQLIQDLRPDWTEEKMKGAEFEFVSKRQQST
jgi:hypothetical protein